jgi:hypothetical protein
VPFYLGLDTFKLLIGTASWLLISDVVATHGFNHGGVFHIIRKFGFQHTKLIILVFKNGTLSQVCIALIIIFCVRVI